MERMESQNVPPKSIYEIADALKEKSENLDGLILKIGSIINSHGVSMKNRYEPKTIIESRFTPAEEAFEKGMLSCGAITNISAAMLRHLGYEVKLIHGETHRTVDHAWISVLDPQTNEWKQYDLAEEDGKISDSHIEKANVDSWEEIKEQIESDHITLSERRRKKGL